MADEDLPTMVREFRESMTEAMAGMSRRFDEMDARFEQVDRRFEQVDHRLGELDTKLDEQGNELRHRISVAETSILNTIRDQARLYDRRTTRLGARVDRIEQRLDLPDEDPPPGAA